MLQIVLYCKFCCANCSVNLFCVNIKVIVFTVLILLYLIVNCVKQLQTILGFVFRLNLAYG